MLHFKLVAALVALTVAATCAGQDRPAYCADKVRTAAITLPGAPGIPIPFPLARNPLPIRPFEWPAYRHDTFHTGYLPELTPLSSVLQVQTLAVRWGFPTDNSEPGGFRASPIVFNGAVFIGSTSGVFYALNAGRGTLLSATARSC